MDEKGWREENREEWGVHRPHFHLWARRKRQVPRRREEE